MKQLAAATRVIPTEFKRCELPGLTGALSDNREDVANVLEVLRGRLASVQGLNGTVRLDFGDEETIYVDCTAGRLVQPCQADTRILVRSKDLLRIIEGNLDPRWAMLFAVMKISGDIEIVPRICNRLAGRADPTSLKGSPALPKATDDKERAKEDLATFGYCLIKDALQPDQVAKLRERLVDQAAAEASAGIAEFDGLTGSDNPPNQRVWNLVNKGQVFIDLLNHPLIDEFAPAVLGDHFIISSYIANIAGLGGERQYLHTDQIGAQPAILDFPLGMNILWFLDDVTETNGGTRVYPGSHLPGIGPVNPFSSDGTTAVAGPAGTALIFETRLWHGTGANETTKRRHVLATLFFRSWVRQQVNPFVSTHPDVLAKFDERLLIMHGYRCTNTHGGKQRPFEGEMVCYDPNELTLEMYQSSD